MIAKNTGISIVLLGEKDHGKSTLIGRLIFETKSLPEDRMRDVRKAIKGRGKKFEWAHLLDSFIYEREHEMTLDTTRAMVNLGGKSFEFIDVPGHKDLIKNMLTGAGDAKFAILTIDINEGIKPQTLRHLDIAEFLGIEKLIIVVNKMDAVGYSKAHFKKAKKIISMVLADRNLSKKDSIIPVSAFSGNNLLKRTSSLGWYKGPTLYEAVLKDFKTTKKNSVIPRQSKTSMVKPICIFIDKPKNKLILESETGEASIKTLGGFQKIHELCQISIILDKPLLLGNKFVIKQNGRIIGICKKTPV